jgi:hypothetical protein
MGGLPIAATEADAATRIFGVESWGCAATHWLAHALDSHPELRCFHNTGGQIFRQVGGTRLDGLEYARFLQTQRLGYRVVGDVHGFSRTAIPDVQRELGDLFRCAVLVRDPVPRYRSELALFRHAEWRVNDASRPWNLDYVKPIAQEAGIKLNGNDYDACLVVHAACMLNVILEERELGPVYRMEDVVSEPDALCSLLETVTAGAVEIDRSWAEAAVARPRLASHSRGDDLSPAELDVLERIVKPEAWQAYRELGYAA